MRDPPFRVLKCIVTHFLSQLDFYFFYPQTGDPAFESSGPETGSAEVWAGASVLDRTAILNCNLYNLEGLPASPSGFLMTTASVDQQSRIHSFRYKIGTTEREKER